jgi:TatD DNase family protein
MFFDAHSHAHFAAYGNETDTVIQRALDAGVWMINVGTQRDTSRGAVEAAHRYDEGVYAAVGIHPTHTTPAEYVDPKELKDIADSGAKPEPEIFDPAVYRPLAEDPKTVAIGECGLDYYRLTEETKHKQQEALAAQVAFAHEVKKPLMIHCRNAFDDLTALLREQRTQLNDPPGVIHFFTGSKDNMQALLDLGFGFTFGGVVTFTRDYDEVVRYAPLDRIVSETDAPYVAPVPYRGKRNEPVYVIETVKKLAEIRGITAEAMEAAIFANAQRIFRIPSPKAAK